MTDRKEHPIGRKDLLDTMLNAKDVQTGQGLSDETITRNVRLSSYENVPSCC